MVAANSWLIVNHEVTIQNQLENYGKLGQKRLFYPYTLMYYLLSDNLGDAWSPLLSNDIIGRIRFMYINATTYIHCSDPQTVQLNFF